MLYDIIRETRAYKEMAKDSLEEGREKGLREGLREGLQKGRKEGLEEGLREGLQKGREEVLQKQLESLRKTLHTLVQARFSNSTATRIAKGQATLINDPAILQDLIIKVGLARTAEEAQKYLLEWSSTDNEASEHS